MYARRGKAGVDKAGESIVVTLKRVRSLARTPLVRAQLIRCVARKQQPFTDRR